MASVARFLLLLAVGVIVVVLYVRSGESLVVLALSLVTLLAGLALWVRQPWAIPAAVDPTGPRADGGRRGDRWDETWRCGHDLTWDDQGIRAVTVGDRLPGLTVWSRVDRITVGRHRATVGGRNPQRRRGIRLGLTRTGLDGPGWPGDGEGRPERWLCLGPDQDPERVAAELASAWRRMAARRPTPRPGHRRPEPPLGRDPKPPAGR